MDSPRQGYNDDLIPTRIIRPVAADDLVSLGAIRSRDTDAGLVGRLSAGSWESVLTEHSRDSRSIFLVALVGSARAGYSLATPAAVSAQRRLVVKSPSLWLDVIGRLARQPKLLLPTITRMGRLVRPLRPDGVPELRLLDIVVAADHRGIGIGGSLLASTLEMARAAGHTAIGLSVLADNVSAINLYTRHGFGIDSETTRGDGRLVLTMSRSL
jgi:ribosomal protein S18 acetylase RimI-like enzyme